MEKLCKRIQVELPERILRALGVSNNNNNLFTTNNLISPSIQQNKLINQSFISNVSTKEINKEENEEEQIVDVESLVNEEDKNLIKIEENKNNEQVDNFKMRRMNISRKSVWRPY
uniref:Uncharacterized protein n=1 Tax=Meloidogyne hapla TaxID=6305 RepID=A0A1I8BM66_MELHA